MSESCFRAWLTFPLFPFRIGIFDAIQGGLLTLIFLVMPQEAAGLVSRSD
jgi:hypothetical protein